jgi:hemolysin activation/secretion protein
MSAALRLWRLALAAATVAAPAAAQVGGLPGRRFEPLPVPGPEAAAPEAPAPALGAPAPAGAAPAPADEGPRFVVRGVRFEIEGPPAIPEDELAAAVSPLIGRAASFADLEAVRRALSELYVEQGYVSSGALLPDQEIRDGIVTFRLVHGRLAEIRVTGEGIGPGGLGALDPAYVARRVDPGEARAFDVDDVQERLRLLLDDRNVARVRGAVRPGDRLGDAVLELDVTARRPFDFGLTLDNASAPSVGEETATVFGAVRNLVGGGDQISVEASVSQGSGDLTLEADAPLLGGALIPFLRAEIATARVVEAPLDALDVESDYGRVAGGLRAPLWRDARRSLDMEIGLELARSETRLLGEPFSFSPGVEDGKTNLTVLSLVHEGVDRGPAATFALRSEVNVGLDLFDATTNDDGDPDGRFVSWIGQAQAVGRLAPWLTVIARAQTQLASDRLLPLEEVSIGGVDTVRGYREGEAVADQAALGSIEGRAALFRLAPPELTPPDHGAEVILAPFVDVGVAWDKSAWEDRTTLAGAGAGLLWSPAPGISVALYAAGALRDSGVDHEERSLQDESIYFSITFQTP